jgi:hypothetical protein
MLTGKMTMAWRDDDTRRVWAMARSAAVHLLGAREGCRAPATVDVSGETRWGGRRGSLSSVVWVPAGGDRVVLEPYCTSPRSP